MLLIQEIAKCSLVIYRHKGVRNSYNLEILPDRQTQPDSERAVPTEYEVKPDFRISANLIFKFHDTKVVEADPMFFIRRAVVALDTD